MYITKLHVDTYHEQNIIMIKFREKQQHTYNNFKYTNDVK